MRQQPQEKPYAGPLAQAKALQETVNQITLPHHDNRYCQPIELVFTDYNNHRYGIQRLKALQLAIQS
jgi:hypothetical protein